jgi:hypothetical protein
MTVRTENMDSMMAMANARTGHSPKKPQRKNSFFREGDYWYFATEQGARFGPFDRVYEIIMGECIMGEWKSEQKEVVGGDIAHVLWT